MNLPGYQKGIIITLVALVLVAEIVAISLWGRGELQDRLSFVFEIVAIYGIGLGFLSSADPLKAVKFKFEGMTSPNLFRFIGDNGWFISVLILVFSLGVRPRKTRSSAVISLGGCLYLLLTPVIFLYAIIHMLIIMPVSYVFFVLASALVENVAYSPRDIEMEITRGATKGRFSVREIVAHDPVAAKSFLLGLTAAILAMTVKFIEVFL